MTRVVILLLCFMAVTGCQEPDAERETGMLSIGRAHGICTNMRGAILEEVQRGADHDAGTIATKDGLKVQYYVSSELGEFGSGHLVETVSRPQRTNEGKTIIEETYSDGYESLRIDGFSSKLDGKPKISVWFFYPKINSDQAELAMRLIKATASCDL